MRMVRCGVILATLSLAWLSTPSSIAQVVTLGNQDLMPTSHLLTCGVGCAGFTVAPVHPAGFDTAPAAGVVTSWRVGGAGRISLNVLEHASGGWRADGVSAPASGLDGESNATDLPIAAGDMIGIDVATEGSFVGVTEPSTAEYYRWAEPPLDEASGRTPATQMQGDLLLSAEVELTPVVSSVTPASGTTAGGNAVTITGKYLDSAVNVVFGSTPATSFKVDLSGEHITAVAPPSAAGTVDVHVSSLHSTSESVAGDRYTFVSPVPSTNGASSPSGTRAPGLGTAAVRVSGFKQSAGRWRLGGALARISSVPVGTTFSFKLNESANVALTFSRLVAGRRAGGRCVTATNRNRSRPRCKRLVTAGSLAVPGHAGLDKVTFQGRLSRSKKLTPGIYTASVTQSRDGLKNLTPRLSFTILP